MSNTTTETEVVTGLGITAEQVVDGHGVPPKGAPEKAVLRREGVLVGLSCQTSLMVAYPTTQDRHRMPKKERHVFTLKNTLHTMRKVVAVHSMLAKGQASYFITSTYPVDMPLKERVKRWGKFVNMLRTLPGYMGHVWVRELHPGKSGKTAQTGTVHMHMLLRCYSPLRYKRLVVGWSTRYNGSVNGLDIKPVKGDVEQYLTKVRNDIRKARHLAHELPCRWWGTSKLARWVKVSGDVPWRVKDSDYRRVKCAVVPEWYALAVVVKATAMQEEESRKKRMLAAARRGKPSPL